MRGNIMSEDTPLSINGHEVIPLTLWEMETSEHEVSVVLILDSTGKRATVVRHWIKGQPGLSYMNENGTNTVHDHTHHIRGRQIMSVVFSRQVWEILSKTEVSDHVGHLPSTGKRPAISYLPWHSAWKLCKKNFPASTYVHAQDIHHLDETVEIEIYLTISDGENDQSSSARLAVMDNYFGAIKNPSARQINDSRQRCLVKALAFAGLGLNLWSDSMMPVGREDDPIKKVQVEAIESLLKSAKPDMGDFLSFCGVDSIEEIPASKYSSVVGLLEAKIKMASESKGAGTG